VTDRPGVPRDVDEDIAGFPRDVQDILKGLRGTIREAAPGARETISHQIPGFILNGNLVHFAAYEKHIGLYPAPAGNVALRTQLAACRSGK
jgi:uncharacterized protein YdhG (YjbR/CyaY superfamily)